MIDTNSPDFYKDLPQEVLEQLKESTARGGKKQRLLDVMRQFDNKAVELNEVIIAYWHSYGQVIKRATAIKYIQDMIREGVVVRISHGVYKINQQEGVQHAR